MLRFVSVFMVSLLPLTSCDSDTASVGDWKGVSFPKEQRATELAFRRLAKNGDIEPVLEVEQELTGWAFRVRRSTADSIYLQDRSGVDYRARRPTGIAKLKLTPEQLWSVNAEVSQLDRDYLARTITATLDVNSMSQQITPR